jgi:hypothetical protein
MEKITEFIATDDDLNKKSIAKAKYPHSVLEIADKRFYTQNSETI